MDKITVKEDVYLLGVSLGGMLAIEIAELLPVKKLILISTIKNRREMPHRLEWLGHLPTKNQLLPKFAVSASRLLKPFYGKANPEGLKLFNDMLAEADLEFIRWGWEQIPLWKFDKEITTPHIHLHGTADLIFPIKYIDHAITIAGATHYAIFNNAEQINKQISAWI